MPMYTVTLWLEAQADREIEAESAAEAERFVTDLVYQDLSRARVFTQFQFTRGKVEQTSQTGADGSA